MVECSLGNYRAPWVMIRLPHGSIDVPEEYNDSTEYELALFYAEESCSVLILDKDGNRLHEKDLV